MASKYAMVDDQSVIIGIFDELEFAKQACIQKLDNACPLDSYGDPRYEIVRYISNIVDGDEKVCWHSGHLPHTLEQFLKTTTEVGFLDFETLWSRYKKFTGRQSDNYMIEREDFFSGLVQLYGEPEELQTRLYYWDIT